MPHLSPTTLTTDEQHLILRATAVNIRDHTIISLAVPRQNSIRPKNERFALA